MSYARIDRAGLPFIVGALGLGLVAGWAVSWLLAWPLVILAGFFLFFFRDPERRIPARSDAHDDVVLSPADGRVLVAGPAIAAAAPPGDWQQVSIFLSPMDVHVNRVPASGVVTRVSYTPGRFLPAYHTDAAASNERSEIWIERGNGQMVVARQIVGILARRVVCRLKPGTTVHAGDRYGIMKFGSRMDIYMPSSAELRVKVGDVVRGGETTIAVLH
jgi:phosphatidylserine decarboxylase